MDPFQKREPTLPLELIENLIIPYSAFSWLGVCKKYHPLAIKHCVNDPTLLADPYSAISNATKNKNYALLNILLSDSRYTARYIISQVINTHAKDKRTNMIFLKQCFGLEWMRDRVVSRAVDYEWIDLIDYTLAHKDLVTIQFAFSSMSQAVFERVILHPKLKWEDNYIANINANTQIQDTVKLKILQVPNINIQLVIEEFQNEVFVDALLKDHRVKNSFHLQLCLWRVIVSADYDRNGRPAPNFDRVKKVRKVLDENLLDPARKNNFPLRQALKQRKLTEIYKYIAQMLLDDNRVVLTCEPFTKNLIYCAIVSRQQEGLTEKINLVLNHPKYNKEWFESVIKYILDDQTNQKTIDNTERIFNSHQFDECLSEEIRARAARGIKRLKCVHQYYYYYDQDPSSDEEGDLDEEPDD